MTGCAGTTQGVEGEAVLRLREQASRQLNEIFAKRVVLMQGPNGELMQCQVCALASTGEQPCMCVPGAEK